MMVLTHTEEIQDIAMFSETEERKFLEIGANKGNKGKWVLSDGRQLLNKPLARKILESMHNKTHWGTQVLSDQFLRNWGCMGIFEIAKQITEQCVIC